MWPPGGDGGGDVWLATRVNQGDQAALGWNRLVPCPLPFFAGDGDACGGAPMWPAGGNSDYDSRPEIGAAPSGRVEIWCVTNLFLPSWSPSFLPGQWQLVKRTRRRLQWLAGDGDANNGIRQEEE
jgi:hypothetical protein